jgi:hypothetical protein
MGEKFVTMTPILEMRHTTPMKVRRGSFSNTIFSNSKRNNRSTTEDDRTARLAGGVVAVQSKLGHAQRSLYIVGGTSLLLPLFAQLEPPPTSYELLNTPTVPPSSTTSFIPPSLPTTTTTAAATTSNDGVDSPPTPIPTPTPSTAATINMNEYDEALELMMYIIQLLTGEFGSLLMNEMNSIETIVPTISVLLHSCDSTVLTSGFLGSVMLFVRDLLPIKTNLAHQVIRDVLLDFG